MIADMLDKKNLTSWTIYQKTKHFSCLYHAIVFRLAKKYYTKFYTLFYYRKFQARNFSNCI